MKKDAVQETWKTYFRDLYIIHTSDFEGAKRDSYFQEEPIGWLKWKQE